MVTPYAPGPAPQDPKDLSRYLNDELRRIALTIQALGQGAYTVTYREPTKPREGDTALAAGSVEGSHWSPDGSGDRKLYQYRQTSPGTYAWVLIG